MKRKPTPQRPLFHALIPHAAPNTVDLYKVDGQLVARLPRETFEAMRAAAPRIFFPLVHQPGAASSEQHALQEGDPGVTEQQPTVYAEGGVIEPKDRPCVCSCHSNDTYIVISSPDSHEVGRLVDARVQQAERARAGAWHQPGRA
ncbi:hypothetical protein [Kutzneria albida]|uniref:Uncharacterized protein n=1 Tax=Kutzneria albida DSM 43870 TaxID=1449976 RepID=W5WB02_9PSEU|nr:hypothetical protein [Kutzneria albida]AHH98318.1 hypothetical protein KALB_4956 [Kutzneria albida DSM 43870]